MTRKTRTNPAQQAIQKARKENAMEQARLTSYLGGIVSTFYRDELVEDTDGNIGRVISQRNGLIEVTVNRRVNQYHPAKLTVVKSPWRTI